MQGDTSDIPFYLVLSPHLKLVIINMLPPSIPKLDRSNTPSGLQNTPRQVSSGSNNTENLSHGAATAPSDVVVTPQSGTFPESATTLSPVHTYRSVLSATLRSVPNADMRERLAKLILPSLLGDRSSVQEVDIKPNFTDYMTYVLERHKDFPVSLSRNNLPPTDGARSHYAASQMVQFEVTGGNLDVLTYCGEAKTVQSSWARQIHQQEWKEGRRNQGLKRKSDNLDCDLAVKSTSVVHLSRSRSSGKS